MVPREQVEELAGGQPGGVCPFGVNGTRYLYCAYFNQHV